MSDLEQLLPGRLSTLADDLTPRADPVGQAAAARSRHRRQRRARIGLAAVAVAVVAVSVGVPTAIDALSAPSSGQVARPGTATPAPPTETEAEAEARTRAEALARLAAASAAESATAAATPPGPGRLSPDPEAQAVIDAEMARGTAELTHTLVELSSPVRLAAPRADAACPDAAAQLSRGLGTHVAYEQGALTDGRGGCQWSTDGDVAMASQPQHRLTVGVAYQAGAVELIVSRLQQTYATSAPDRSLVVPVTAVDPQAVLVRFANAGTVEWSLYVPTTDGTGTWVLSAFVGDGIASPAAGAALLQVAALASATWGG